LFFSTRVKRKNMQAENFSEQDSLKLINEMIGKAKKSYVTKGIASIVWGIMIVFCSMVSWSEAHYKYNIAFDIWLILMIAIMPQVYFTIKERRAKKFVGYDEISTGYVWTAFGISIFITSLYFSNHSQAGQGSTIVMMLYAVPTFITGGISKFKPMIIGGIICWIASIVSVFTNTENDLLLMAACGFFAWIVPGIILWNRYQKGKSENV
jgi:hypothetical protein